MFPARDGINPNAHKHSEHCKFKDFDVVPAGLPGPPEPEPELKPGGLGTDPVCSVGSPFRRSRASILLAHAPPRRWPLLTNAVAHACMHAPQLPVPQAPSGMAPARRPGPTRAKRSRARQPCTTTRAARTPPNRRNRASSGSTAVAPTTTATTARSAIKKRTRPRVAFAAMTLRATTSSSIATGQSARDNSAVAASTASSKDRGVFPIVARDGQQRARDCQQQVCDCNCQQ